MIPNFALSLSLEGLRLLHRGTAGWTRIGEVALDSADLSGDLARLRAAALAHAPEGLRTKLLIPNDQIRYLVLDGARDADAVATALEGTTPYAVDELVIDFVVEAGRTHVAAVARETLEEAESFAREHALEPVAFAAVPAPDDFPGEVLFGPVPGLGAAVARDDDPVHEVPSEPVPVPLAEDASLTPEVDDTLPPEVDDIPPPETDGPLPDALADPALPRPQQPPLDAADTAAHEDVGASSETSAPLPPGPAEEDTDAPGAAMAEPPRPEPAADASAPASSRAAAPQEMDEDDDLLAITPPARTPEPRPQVAPPVEPEARGPGEDDPVQGDDAQHADAQDDAALDTPPTPPRPVTPPADTPLPPRGDTAQPAPAPGPDGSARRIMPPAMPRPGAPPAAMPAMPEKDDVADQGADAETAALAAGAALVSPAADTPAGRPLPTPRKAHDRASERERMTVFGARSTAPERHPGRVALIAAVVAIAVLALLASLWLGSGEEEPQAGLLRDAAPTAAPAAEDVAAAAPQDPASDPVATATPAPQPDYDDYPAPDPGPTAAVSPAEAERIYAATGVWLRAPRLPLTPRAEPFGTPLSVALEPVSATAGGTRLAAAAPDGGLPMQADPPPAGSVFARDARGFIAATAEGTVTPQGLVIYEGRPDAVPPTRPGTVAPPPEQQADAEATPEDAPSGEPVTIVVPGSGDDASEAQPAAPPVVPPTRPDTVETDAQADAAGAVTPGGVALDALRPARRPEEAAPEPLAAYEGPRPPLRPEGLVPDAEPQVTQAADAQAAALAQAVGAAPDAPPVRASVADALASLMADAPDPLANATPQAVPTARRPDQRPRNFDRVVARSRATAPPSGGGGGEAQPVANATVAPDGPVPGSVARASTSNNAINLSDINLIGVYGKPGARRALIRMQNGRYLRVGIGDSLDGGRVTAIGDDVLNYVRRGRTQVLKIPD
ncbi:hypothetical protein [Limimaricola hongkongensis]|uniref:Translation initiation factor 2 (IF-2/ GTPase) n=1 Tax=Limimaricola hongkongensis DSM 17492 TaxID=1122180 RepID=A0A017HA14_9RHOB|nr:hypothetical protein [Limimaricola hongkongensis]EYD70983.1 Translation initiation factor 2 (IF-2/ GTPase) [Limimaricola hongkongensis DSM 17492]